jgi:hypothetical protein
MARSVPMRRVGLHQRQKLVAQIDEGLALAAPAQGEAENLAVKRERLVDVADFQRDVIDADEAGQIGGHMSFPFPDGRGRLNGYLGSRCGEREMWSRC